MKNTKGYPVYCSNCAGRIMAMLALLRLVNQIEEAPARVGYSDVIRDSRRTPHADRLHSSLPDTRR